MGGVHVKICFLKCGKGLKKPNSFKKATGLNISVVNLVKMGIILINAECNKK